MDFEGGEGEGVTDGIGGVDEQGAELLGGVDFHFCGELFGEEGGEEEVEFAGVGELVDAGVAEADGLAEGFGDEGDDGLGVERDAEAFAVDGGSEGGVGVDVDDDASVDEGDFGVVGEDGAACVGLAAEVVAGRGAGGSGDGEELGFEGALEGAGGDADFDGVGREGGGEEKNGEQEEVRAHGLRIMERATL